MPSILDRYLLRQLASSLLVCLGTVLIALLLERLLRLFDILAQNSHALPAVAKLIACLVPHYLGLALPAAFFVALFLVIAKLSDDNELDAYLAGGLSIARLTKPFLATALLLSLLSIGLFGYLQPYARYTYRTVLHAALNAGWDARLQAGTFISPGQGYTLSADGVDDTGRRLQRVFVHRLVDGEDQISTSEIGVLQPHHDGTQLTLTLDRGEHLRHEKTGNWLFAQFDHLSTSTEFSPNAPALGARGRNERELTLDELLRGGVASKDVTAPSGTKIAGELQGRLARIVSLLLLPLLAVPLGMAAKRGERTGSMIVAATLMLLFHHTLQLGESLAESGKLSALVGVWTPTLVFAVLTLWLYSQSLERPGDNPVSRLLSTLDGYTRRIGDSLRPNRRARLVERNTPDRRRSVRKRKSPVISHWLFGPLPRYLRGLLTMRVVSVLLALGGLLQILDLLEATTEIMARGQGMSGVGRYISLRAPTLLLQALPLAALIGAVFAFTTLAKQHEVVAMRAAGLPFRRVVLLLLPTVLVIMAAQWLLAERVVPKSQRALTSWWAALPPPKDDTLDTDLLWFKSGGVVIGVARAHPDGRLLESVRIFRRDEKGHLLTRTTAAKAIYTDRQWTLTDAAITDFAAAQTAPVVPQLAWDTALRPSDVQRISAAEPYVSGGLAAAVLSGDSSGIKTPAFYRTRVQKAFADPAMAFVMLLLATPVAVALTRGAKGTPMLVSLTCGLLFLLVHGLCSALGEAGLITPFAAAWIAPVSFGLLGFDFLLRLDRHQ